MTLPAAPDRPTDPRSSDSRRADPGVTAPDADPDPQPAILVLEDGRTFEGTAFGARGTTFGEAVFATAMTGYQETMTDPSYHRQVVVMTAPHVGNTGWNDQDDESNRIWVAGFVVRDPARMASNWRSLGSLEQAMVDQGIVGICDIDTRALTRHLRDKGAMRVGVSSSPDIVGPQVAGRGGVETLLAQVREQPSMAGQNLVADVTTTEPYVVPAEGERRFSVAAIDLGIKAMTPQRLAERGLEVHVLPATTSYEQVRELGVDGLFFSNGPGDPSASPHQVELLQQALSDGMPYFGICFGNQLFGRALGLDTFKLPFGHRGVNQPVQDLATGKVEITSQNHGFAVRAEPGTDITTPYGTARVSHLGLNDQVVEGLELRNEQGDLVAFSVQYHPEAAAGPHDAAHLFDRFVELLGREEA